jgi:hypothetical protein
MKPFSKTVRTNMLIGKTTKVSFKCIKGISSVKINYILSCVRFSFDSFVVLIIYMKLPRATTTPVRMLATILPVLRTPVVSILNLKRCVGRPTHVNPPILFDPKELE